MNRKRFIALIAMMLVSLIGIIWVQMWWIKGAMTVLNDTFDSSVSLILRDAAEDIESSRKMKFFNNFLMSSSPFYEDTTENVSRVVTQSYSSANNGSISLRITSQSVTQEPGKQPVVVTHDTIVTTDTSAVIMSSPEYPGKVMMVNPDENVGNRQGTVAVSRKEFIDMLRKRSTEFQNMSDQMISEVAQWEQTMDINKNEVNESLHRALYFSQIRTPYEFAIIKNGKIADGNFKKAGKNEFLKSKYSVRLFPDNIIRQNIVLSVIFPEKTNYVLGSMVWILGGSFIFSLIILATFAMSLYFIIRQKKVSEMKSDFLNNMTHEFKTPIATISLAADTITNPRVINDEASVRHFIGMIKKENSRMNKKVETILQIASLDKKEMDFRFEIVSLHSIIERAVDSIDIHLQQRSGKVTLNLKAEIPEINGDAEHLYNLVNNLLDNAMKYSPESPDITITTCNKDKGIMMSVEDRGIGMTKSVQSRIFERFYRQTSGNVHDVKGFGLGLNYVRAIIEAHRGNVSVTSEPGKGSRFDVFLPFNQES
jgi:two-component system, OmpR family, phosphate regulon sensor histidine kinase PhoR